MTTKSCATLTTTLTTIPETEDDIKTVPETATKHKAVDKLAKKWVFQGKVQGSVVFRQYYPEGGWGWVIVLVGVTMLIQTTGFQLSFGVLFKPAIWKFKPSHLSFVFLSGISLSTSMLISPLVVALCKVRCQNNCDSKSL